MSLNIILYFSSFQQTYLQFCLTFIQLYSDHSVLTLIQVLMFVCPTFSELSFYGCCHPCYEVQKVIKNRLALLNNKSIKQLQKIFFIFHPFRGFCLFNRNVIYMLHKLPYKTFNLFLFLFFSRFTICSLRFIQFLMWEFEIYMEIAIVLHDGIT